MASGKRLNRSIGGSIFLFVVLAIFCFLMALPLIYSLSTSLKPSDELFLYPPKFLVENPTFKNFKDLYRIMSSNLVPLSRYVFNTVFISVVGTAGHVLISSMCAYGLSKYRLPGGKLIFNTIVTTLMFTTAVTSIPTFLVFRFMGIIDTHLTLILPAFAAPLGLYLMKQFMDQMVPDTILEAARIDGAHEFHIFFRIVMPIVRPAWLTLIIFSFQGLWNTAGSVFIYSEKLKTFNYAMSQIMLSGVARAGAGAAASVVMLLVPLVVFIVAQSNVVETMATSGMKD